MQSPLLQNLLRGWRENARLRWLAALIVLVLVFEGAMRWWGWFDSLSQQRTRLEISAAQLKAQSRDTNALQATLASVQGLEKQAKARLLTTRSEAAAQAQLQDWVLELARSRQLLVNNVVAGAARPATTTKTERPDEQSRVATDGLLEFPLNITLMLTAESVAAALSAVETGPWLLRVHSVSIRVTERRIVESAAK
jgi:Tfp pilus assembly protein PilO